MSKPTGSDHVSRLSVVILFRIFAWTSQGLVGGNSNGAIAPWLQVHRLSELVRLTTVP